MPRTPLVDRVLLAVAVLGVPTIGLLALGAAPSVAGRTGFTAPLTWKLFFFHVPIAFVSFAAFAVAVYHSVQYLHRRKEFHDWSAHAAIEVGVLFAGLTLATGMIWGRAEWGVAWRWADAKLTVVLVMFLVYGAYLFLRSQIGESETRARLSALYAIAAFATVPLAWFAQRIWLSFHPTVFGPGSPDAGIVTPGILPLFVGAVLVFGALFAFLYRWRRQLLALRARVELLETAEVVLA